MAVVRADEPQDGELKQPGETFPTAVSDECMQLGHVMSGDSDAKLSPRELQCLSLLACGHSNDGIAQEIGIRPPTVAMHLANARAKLKAVTREHAIAIAVSRGLIKI